MKIALFASNRTTAPPQPGTIAASTALVSVLADQLVDRGHQVTLYAPSGSVSKAEIVDLGLPPARLDYAATRDEWDSKDSMGEKAIYLAELYRQAGRYDIINLHTEPVYLGMPLAALCSTPTIFTNHNTFRRQQERILQYYSGQHLVTISDYQRKCLPGLNYLATIYNGIAVEDFPQPVRESYTDLCSIGRLVPAKGVPEAIAAARSAGVPLRIAGAGKADYIEREILPRTDAQITYVGSLDSYTNAWFEHYGSARATLMPIQWEEPFGMVAIESMAAGTPVIAIARGAMPEIITDGVTGFLVNPADDDKRGDFTVTRTGVAGMQEAITRLFAMAPDSYLAMREGARRHVARNFSVDAMVTRYEEAYRAVLAGHPVAR